ncbi:MAG: hypothetical protein WBL50_25750 [Candidatus Acidiferrum sp.]
MAFSRIEVMHARSNMPLVERGRTERTFMGLGAFAATVLLLGGGYLMTEALLNPLSASDVGVLTAGFALALASFLSVYLLSPRRRIETAMCEKNARNEEKWNMPVLTVYGETVQKRIVAKQILGEGKNLPGPM